MFSPKAAGLVMTPFRSSTVNVSFGDKTLKGYGGADLGYTRSGTLTITAGNTGSIWAINAYNMLVPAGTYGASAPTYAGPYTLTVTDGTNSCTVIVTMIPDAYSVAWRPGNDNNTNELYGTTNNAASFVRGTTRIICRPGAYNPSAQDLRISQGAGVPSGASGWVRIEAEIPYQTIIWGLGVSGNAATNKYLEFYQITFRKFNTIGSDGSSSGMLYGTNNPAYIRAYKCFFQGDTSKTNITDANSNTFTSGIVIASTGGGIEVVDCQFDTVDTGMRVGGPNLVITGNYITNVFVDGIFCNGTPSWTVENNLIVNHKGTTDGAHGDFIQFLQTGLSAGSYPGGTISNNIQVRGLGTPGLQDGQGGPFLPAAPADITPGVTFTSVKVQGNFYLGSFTRGVTWPFTTGIEVSFNTTMTDTSQGFGNTAFMEFFNMNGGNARYNAVAGAVSDTTPVSPVTVANNQINQGNDRVVLATKVYDPQDGAAYDCAGRSRDQMVELIMSDWALIPNGSFDTTPYKTGCFGTGYYNHLTNTGSWPLP